LSLRFRLLAGVLFFFEPFLAANLLLRVGPSLVQRDAATWVAFAMRIALALASIAAAKGLADSRPYARKLAVSVLLASAAFAVIQYFTRVLPTSLAPDVAALVTLVVVVHHAAWLGVIAFSEP
jgi:hypothetical protein